MKNGRINEWKRKKMWILYRNLFPEKLNSMKVNKILCKIPSNLQTMSKLVCIICDEKVPPSKATSCPYCEFNPCRTCVRKYVLNESDTKCMNCKKTWTRAHQNVILLAAFVNGDLRVHQEQVFYEMEMALFPITIEVIEERRVLHRLTYEYRIMQERLSAKLASIRYLSTMVRENDKLISMKSTMPKMFADVNPEELMEKNKTISMQYDTERAEWRIDQQRDQVIRRFIDMTPDDRKIAMAYHIEGADPAEILETLRQTGQLGEASKRARTQFIRACPIETCRGFLSQQWKCGLCNISTCSKCNIPKIQTSEDHVCNPDDVATAELLAKDTKPCPKCGTGIFKIDGCDQMWCTECRTAFNWRTGQLETGHFHNPHYFEYQRRIGANVRNILDMPCNAMQPEQYHGTLYHLMNVVVNLFNKKREKLGIELLSRDIKLMLQVKTADYSVSIERFANGILPRYRPDAIQNNLELRIQYLTEQITKDEFKSALSREAKQFNKKLEIGQVVQTVVFGMSDILTRLAILLREISEPKKQPKKQPEKQPEKQPDIDEVETIFGMFSEIDVLIDYGNECLEFICKQYKLTRVAIFVRNIAKKHHPGLYTVRVVEETLPEGKVTSLVQVRLM